jgi:hypothetical protein
MKHRGPGLPSKPAPGRIAKALGYTESKLA